MKNDSFFMQNCLNLAKMGFPNNTPNPMVGCVIVYKGKIIGKGYHKKYGSNHAEVNAINNVKDKSLLKKSTLYVNLEPCSHFGKTPPCSDTIIKNKIPRVVIGCIDSCSKVSGEGIKKMKSADIEVTVGILEDKCRKLNKRFFTYHEKSRPYIILKWAKSKDNFIAPINQIKPFWMTSNESKKRVHRWRSEETGILVGTVTAEKDNPNLTVREVNGKNPIRIVIDRTLRLSNNLNLFNNKAKTIVFNESKNMKNGSIKYIKISFKNLINNILKELYKQNIQSLIIEGGSKTLQSFIDNETWDEARIFTTNKILKNGIDAPRIIGKTTYEEAINSDSLVILHQK